MYDVQIPEGLYQRATQAAEAHQVSVDEFIVEALEMHLQNDVLWLTPDQLAKVSAGLADVKAGRVYTPEQSQANLEAHRNAWLAGNPD